MEFQRVAMKNVAEDVATNRHEMFGPIGRHFMTTTNDASAIPANTVDPCALMARTFAYLRVDNEGGALVEFALVLPMLLMVFCGIFVFSIAMTNYAQLTESVNTGSRLLAISRGQTLNPCSTTASAVYAAAPSLTPSKFTFSFVLNGTTYPGATCSSSTTTSGAAGNLVQGGTASVTVTYPCNLSVWGVNYAPSCALKAQTTELVQ
jgi:Flp pilus assembly protein TadG